MSFGRSAIGASATSIEGQTVGSLYHLLYDAVIRQMWAYINNTVAAKACTAAIYRHSDLALMATSNEITLPAASGTAWRGFGFAIPLPHLVKDDYVLVVNSAVGTGVATLFYDTGDVNQGHTETLAHTSFPDNPMTATHNNNQYSIFALCTPDRDFLQYTRIRSRRGHSTNTVCNMLRRF